MIRSPFTAPTRPRSGCKHTQIVHLTVKMPADGSRGGLLYAILLAIDSAVYTNYFNEYNKRWMTIEKLMLKCAQLLALYSVGILVVEEMQANFIASKHGDELKRSSSGFSVLAFRWC